MLEETLVELIEFVKAAAPEVWAIYVKQVYVEAAQNILIGLVVAIAGLVFLRLGVAKRKEGEDDEGSFWLLMAVVATVAVVVMAVPALGRLLNPEYYALQNILNLLP